MGCLPLVNTFSIYLGLLELLELWAKGHGCLCKFESYFPKGGVISFLVSRIRENACLSKCFVVTRFVDLIS